jgi:hypothetical protein
VDTAAILLAYFSTYFYSDTLVNDAETLIALQEEVTQHQVVERILTFQNRRPTLITSTTVVQAAEPRVQLYASLLAGRELTAPVVQVGYKKWQFSAGYNLHGGGVVGGVGYRIR